MSHESWISTLTRGSTLLRGLFFFKVTDSKILVVKTIHMFCMVYRSQTDIVTVDRIFRIFLVVVFCDFIQGSIAALMSEVARKSKCGADQSGMSPKIGGIHLWEFQKEGKIWPLMAQFVHPRSLTARPMKIIVGRWSGLLFRPFIEFQG